MVLLGRTGAGKSSSGNTILGNQVFPISLTGVTKECKRGTSIRFGRRLQVIDTPRMYDTEMPTEDIAREVVKCVGMTAPGPHAFILPVSVDRFTEEEQNTIEHFLNIFGRGMLDYLIILFTRKDDLIYNNQTIEDFLGKESNKLKSILEDCNGRYVSFNNRGSHSEKDQDVQTLLEVIDKMVHDNGGKVYTNEMYQEAEKVMQEKDDQLKREYEETMQSQLDEVRRQTKLQVKQLEQDHEEVIKQFSTRLEQLDTERASQSSTSDWENIRRQLQELKLQHKNEIQAIRDLGAKKVQVDFREQARCEAVKGGSFLKDKMLPALMSLGKEFLPHLLAFGLAVIASRLKLKST
ncbi:GTPase IMAP family member 9-like isoform X2 [Haliotis rufescens]|nr:GTPase IMAP family member 9-like isoform X2 [Haliotis rufescens]